MGAVIRGRDREFPVKGDSWYLVVYFNESLQYLSIPSSSEKDLERLALVRFLFELSGVPHIILGIAREGVYELGERFFERLKEEHGIDPSSRAEKDALSLISELEKMEEFYMRLGFLEDLEEVMEMRNSAMELLEKLKRGK